MGNEFPVALAYSQNCPCRLSLMYNFFRCKVSAGHCDYKTVSVILGHANIGTTLDLYVHPNLEQKQKCINRMFKSLR